MNRDLKAVVLAAGRGTRMRGLTQELPKPMIRVWGKPILEHILAGVQSAGIRDTCIITGWKADVVEDYFGARGGRTGRITYRRQERREGTGKAPELAKDFLGQSPFLLTYGDVLVNPRTYSRMVERFQEGRLDGVIAVTKGQDVTQGGLNLFDEDFNLTRLLEKPDPRRIDQLRADGVLRAGRPLWYNAGIYIFKPLVFDFTARLERSPRGEYELTDAISAMASAGHRIGGVEVEGSWVDVRDPETLARLHRQASAEAGRSDEGHRASDA